MVPFIAARAAPIAPLGSPNESKLHSTRPRCWTHLPKQVVQVTAGFLQGRAFCRNARAESLCVIQSTCTRAGRGTYACERACWLAEPGRPGGKQWGFGAANPPESIPAHRPALPAAISHRTLAASSSTQSQCTRERSKLKLSVPATQQPAFFPKQNPHRVACCCRECPVFNAVFPNRPTTLHQRAQASGSAKPLSEHRERINRRTAVQ